MSKKQKCRICAILYGVIFALTSAPVFCGYVLDGGDAAMWLARIQEVKQSLSAGALSWFPSAELIVAYNSGAQSFDSGLWLLVPALLQWCGIEEQMAWCLFVGLLGLGTVGAVHWMLEAFFQEEGTVLCGVVFYMSCPYRIYVSYDKADLGMILVWALSPVLIGGLARLYQSKGKSVTGWCTSTLAYAGIWYADARMGVVIGVCTALYLLLWQHWPLGILSMLAGGILAMPTVIYLARYLIKGGMQVWQLPQGSIMGNGYAVGNYLTSWTYRPDLPGIGLGLMAALLLLAWLYWSSSAGKMDHSVKGLLIAAGVLTLFSLKQFPWDYVQRLGMPFLRFVGLLETPGIFWGCANLIWEFPAAWAVYKVRKKQGYLWQWGIPVIIILAALATGLYMCNSLTYVRPPLGQETVWEVSY